MKEGRPDARHQSLREALGPLALGHLDGEEQATLRAHLDGCADCRSELADIAPLVRRLDTVDPDRLVLLPSPPPGLGARIHRAVADERARTSSTTTRASGPRHSRTLRRTPLGSGWLLGAAAALVAVGLVGGLVLGRVTAPAPEPPTAVPLEPISLTAAPAADDDVSVAEAGLVPHTWGVELRFVGAGFDEGDTFRAAFRVADTGELVPAGEFRGTGSATMSCNLQSAVLRDDVTEVVVTDEDGDTVLRAPL